MTGRETLPESTADLRAAGPAETFRDLPGLAVYSTCPSSRDVAGAEYLRTVRRVSEWSDAAGCAGMLVYTDNGLVDPWILAHEVLLATRDLAPLVAVQPLYMHPLAVAKAVSSFGALLGRRVALNLVAGGFAFDLAALGDELDHDRRYERLAEYGRLIVELLSATKPVIAVGEFYSVYRLKLSPPLDPALFPTVMVSGSSPAGRRCAEAIGAVAVEYPGPAFGQPGATAEPPSQRVRGMRIGVLARPERGAAWAEAQARFPEDPTGRQMYQAVLSISDSVWHHQLSMPDSPDFPTGDSVYWLGPYRTYRTFCPYLVGSYEDVARYLRAYLSTGYQHIILDEPQAEDDLLHALRAFELALADE